MTTAREKIKKISKDTISPYERVYRPKEKTMIIQESKRYDTKYILLIFYIILALIIILGVYN